VDRLKTIRPRHYHQVQMPGEDETHRVPCGMPDDICPYGKATPRQLGDYLRYAGIEGPRAASFEKYLELCESGIPVDQSIVDMMMSPIRNPKTSKTVPITVKKNDGTRWVVGQAEVEVDQGDVIAKLTLEANSLISHVTLYDLGSFSFSTVGVSSPSEVIRSIDNDQDVCTDPDCVYMEPHKHGFACTKGCHCNRNGRVD
jgi:hypothetical protein